MSIDAAAAAALPGVVAVLTYEDSPAGRSPPRGTRTPTTTRTTPLRARPDRPVRRPAGRRRGRRDGRRRAEAACALIDGRLRGPARRHRPGRRWRPARRCCTRTRGHADGRHRRPAAATSRPRSTARPATWRAGFAGGRRGVRGDLPQPAGAARAPGDARHHRLAGAGPGGWCCGPAPRCRSSPATRCAAVFGLAKDQVRVLAERVGGGFGGKQEMLTEDIVALAVLRTGRPVQLELTREEQFTAATTRHPMAITVRLGATRRRHADRARSSTSPPTPARTATTGRGALPRVRRVGHRLPLPEQEGRRRRRLHQHRAGRGVPRLRPVAGGVRGRVRARRAGPPLGIDPVEFRRRNVIRPGDALVNGSDEADDVRPSQLRPVRRASTWWRRRWPRGRGEAAPPAAGLAGRDRDRGGDARHDPARRPRRARPRSRSGRTAATTLFVGTAEFGNGTTTVHRQLAADALGLRAGRCRDLLLRHRPVRARHRGVRLDRASWSRARRRCGRRGRWPTLIAARGGER